MTDTIKAFLISASALLLIGCQGDDVQVNNKSDATAIVENKEADSILVPSNRLEQQAYALGSTFASRLSQNLEHPQQLGIELDPDFVLQGIEDAFKRTSQITPAAATEILEALQEDMAQAAARKELSNSTASDQQG